MSRPNERANRVSDPRYAELRATLAQTLRRRMVEAGERVPDVHPRE